MIYFNALTTVARKLEPTTVAEANAYAVLRVIRWGLLAVSVVAMAVLATGYWFYKLGGIVRAVMAADIATANAMRPQALTTEQLATASESIVIDWPETEQEPVDSESIVIDWPETEQEDVVVEDAVEPPSNVPALWDMGVRALRPLAYQRGVSIRENGVVLQKAELIQRIAATY